MFIDAVSGITGMDPPNDPAAFIERSNETPLNGISARTVFVKRSVVK
jgi:hypothetical protein